MKLYSLKALPPKHFQKAEEIPPGKFPRKTFVIVNDAFIKYDTDEAFEPQPVIFYNDNKYKYLHVDANDMSIAGCTELEKIKSYIWILDIK